MKKTKNKLQLIDIQVALINYKSNYIEESEGQKSIKPKNATLYNLLHNNDAEINKQRKQTLLKHLFIKGTITVSSI